MELERRTLTEYLQETVRRKGKETAVIYRDRSFSWKELDRCSDLFAVRLLASGVREGDHIGIWSSNSYNWIVVFLAAAKLNCLSVAINTAFKGAETARITDYADLNVLCYGDGYKETEYAPLIEQIRKERPQLLCIPIGDRNGDLQEEDFSSEERGTVFTAVRTDCEKELAMLLTSGTTGDPKGVLLTHYNLTNTARNTIASMGWKPEDRMCITVPLFHCFGLTSSLISSVILGMTMCLIPSFRSQATLECVQKQKCTILNGVPSMFLAMIRNPHFPEYDHSSLRCGIIAGSSIFPSEYMQICECFSGMKLIPSYGQTETSPAVSFSPLSDPDEKNALNAGKIIPHVEARVVSLEKRQVLAAGQIGELEVRGYNVMKGYYKMPEKTASLINEEGWLKTGDLAYFDEEGYLYIRGRCKDLIIRGGENISPQEIEETMLRKIPWIENVCIVSLPAPVVQEKVTACVILKKGQSLQPQKIRSILREELADYKIPEAYVCLSLFPTTSSGKVRCQELQEQVRAGKYDIIEIKDEDAMNKLQERSMITSDAIYQDLLEKIVNLTYMPGDALSENELCAAYNCSRHMVRGAFAQLKQKGLLQVYPQRGSYVSLIDLKMISDVLFLREAAETAVVRQIIEENKEIDDVVVLLEKMIAEQQKAAAKGADHLQEYFFMDDLFHQVLMDTAGRGGVQELLDDSYIHLRRWRNLEVRSTKRIPGLIQEHIRICEAIRQRDKEKARELMHSHFDTLKYADRIDEGSPNVYFYR